MVVEDGAIDRWDLGPRCPWWACVVNNNGALERLLRLLLLLRLLTRKYL